MPTGARRSIATGKEALAETTTLEMRIDESGDEGVSSSCGIHHLDRCYSGLHVVRTVGGDAAEMAPGNYGDTRPLV